MYRLKINKLDNEVCIIIREEDNANIPLDENNIDYQKYLEWVAQGNTPLPVEE